VHTRIICAIDASRANYDPTRPLVSALNDGPLFGGCLHIAQCGKWPRLNVVKRLTLLCVSEALEAGAGLAIVTRPCSSVISHPLVQLWSSPLLLSLALDRLLCGAVCPLLGN
jgi:hypothetical protein